jgi:hypothetical protein
MCPCPISGSISNTFGPEGGLPAWLKLYCTVCFEEYSEAVKSEQCGSKLSLKKVDKILFKYKYIIL